MSEPHIHQDDLDDRGVAWEFKTGKSVELLSEIYGIDPDAIEGAIRRFMLSGEVLCPPESKEDCGICQHRHMNPEPKTTHCYMFRVKPCENCAQHKPFCRICGGQHTRRKVEGIMEWSDICERCKVDPESSKWRKCMTCAHFHRCRSLGYTKDPNSKECDFSPSRYKRDPELAEIMEGTE